MKIAISAVKPDIESNLDPRFGRCAYFVFVDSETLQWEALPNPAMNARGGAGTMAAQFVANEGAKAVISGEFGPNAYAALNIAGIRGYVASNGKVSQLISDLNAGKLTQVSSATGPERHGGGFGRGRGGF
jgi:predicted Fe-Mo cluster-binding NifX family protein